jgi:hypothetical protein
VRKLSLRRPPSDRRPMRRSLVELTAVASRELGDGLSATPAGSVAAVADRTPRRERAAEIQATPETPVAAAEVASLAASDSGELSAPDSTADLAVKIAKEFQERALEDFRISMNAALDHAKDLVDTRTRAGGAPKGGGPAKPEAPILTGLEAAARYRAEALEILKANVETTLGYVHELARARSPADFVELSSEHVRKQCEFALKQTGALKSLARAATKRE